MADQAKDLPSLLLDKMFDGSDTKLVLGEKYKEIVQTHATILRLHSPVLA
jgi:hypothetical protein